MAIVRSLTADKIYAIEAATVVDAEVRGDNLILITHDGTEIDAGNIRGPIGASGDHNTLINLNLDNHPQYLKVDGARPMTGPLLLAADPTQPLGAATRQYVAGRGGSMKVSSGVPSSTTSQSKLAYLAGSTVAAWGGVTRSGDSLVCPVAGWYKMSFNGYFASNTNGTVRLMSIGTDIDPTGGTDQAGATPGPLGDLTIASHVSEPSFVSGGYGAPLSGVGFGYVSAANTKVSLWARQDSGASILCVGRVNIELVRLS